MSNLHGLPNVQAELQAHFGDLLAPAILNSSLTMPGAGMTLPAFYTSGYVRNGSPTRLVYVNQPAAPVTLAGGAGAYWLALMHDTHSAVAGWTRQAGTHYCWQAAATQPADPPGGLVMASVTVTGANITAVDITTNYPATKVAFGGYGGGLAFDKNLTWYGTTLTVVGTVTADHHLVGNPAGNNLVAFQTSLTSAGGTNRWAYRSEGDAPSALGGALTVGGTLYVADRSTFVNAVGCGGAAQGGFNLYTYGPSSLALNVSVNLGTAAATATLDINGTVRSRGALAADSSATVTGATSLGHTLTVANTTYLASYTGIAAAPTPPYLLTLGGGKSIIATGGSLGIGIDPSYPLHVANQAVVGVLGVGGGPAVGFIAAFAGSVYVNNAIGVQTVTPTSALHLGGGASGTLRAEGDALFDRKVALGTGAPVVNMRMALNWAHSTEYGLVFRPNDGNDVGTGHPVQFYSAGGGIVGNISTTASATAYNTTSDARLKHAIITLSGALDVIRGLRPVHFRHNADDSPDEGFLAQELMTVIPRAVTGAPDAVHEDGSIRPQQVDYSKLVVWLVGAVQTLAQHLEQLSGGRL